MNQTDFKLTAGVDVQLPDGFCSAYEENENGFGAVLSAEKLLPLVRGFVDILAEPVFFFVELPKNVEDEDGGFERDVYYLDNCTLPVARAVIKRYGDLLVQDGISCFGFGSHATNEEVYCQSYQQISLYCPENKQKAKALLEGLDVKQTDKLVTMWDSFSEDTPGTSIRIELNGENVFDIPENLKSEGMYKYQQ